MLLLVASIAVADGQGVLLEGQAKETYDRLKPAVAVVMKGSSEVGMAALIDASGLFVFHKSLLVGSTVNVRLNSGKVLKLKLVGQDSATQLVLMKAERWPVDGPRPIGLPGSDVPLNSSLIAVLPTGAIKAQYVSGATYSVQRYGMRRYVPMSEVRFEAPIQAVSGALLFTNSGDLLGALSATQPLNDFAQNQQSRSIRLFQGNQAENGGQVGIKGGAAQKATNTLAGQATQGFGPAPLTVAYTPALESLRRTFEGFRTPSHKVNYATLGVFTVDYVGGGALVQRVFDGSAAMKAGIKVGDVIQSIGPAIIGSQIEFGMTMFRQEPGAKVVIRVKRGGGVMLLDVTFDSSSD